MLENISDFIEVFTNSMSYATSLIEIYDFKILFIISLIIVLASLEIIIQNQRKQINNRNELIELSKQRIECLETRIDEKDFKINKLEKQLSEKHYFGETDNVQRKLTEESEDLTKEKSTDYGYVSRDYAYDMSSYNHYCIMTEEGKELTKEENWKTEESFKI